MEKFVITKQLTGEYQFNLKTGNEEILLTGDGFPSKSNCRHVIETVQQHAAEEDKYDLRTSTNGKYFFTLEAANGQTIAVSKMYETEASRNNGIVFVKSLAPKAIIYDSTF